VIGLHTGIDEQRSCGVSGDVRESGVLGKEHGFLNGFLELLIVEVRRVTPLHEWDSEREHEGVR
jgi:hypothetical protein